MTGDRPPVPPKAPAAPSSPTSTYRFQLTPDNGFAALAARADYLDRLGVSHAYVSPVLQAAAGSTHGYDVVDHGRIDDELGGEDGFRAAVAALQSAGLALVVDVVPNHMAITVPEHLNRVLWSVLQDGVESRYAHWLDVDWSLGRPILLPVLGRRIDECLDSGEITVDLVGGPDGTPVVRYFDHVLPVRPGTESLSIEDLLAAQHYRLAFWRVADMASGIGNRLSLHVVDGNGDATGHHTFLAIARTEIHEGFQCQAALNKVGMFALKFIQTEFQRGIRSVAFGLRFRRGSGLCVRLCRWHGFFGIARLFGFLRSAVAVGIDPFGI